MKNLVKLIGIIALIAVIGFSMVTCDFGGKDDTDNNGNDGNGGGGGNDGGGSGGTNPSITIKNNTGYGIDTFNFKPSTETQKWSSTWWPVGGLEDGKTFEITLDQPLSVHKVYDFKLQGGQYSFRKYGVTVSNKITITFNTSDLNNGSAEPSITIQNRSGKNFDSVYIKPSVISDWGTSFGSVSSNNDLSANILIPPTNYTVFDIQMKSSNPTNTYTRNNVTISNGMILLFTSADKDNPTIEPPVIIIQNNTGYTVTHIWVRQSGSETWSEALTEGWSVWLYNEKSLAFSVPRSLPNQIDIKLPGGDNYNFIKTNVTLSDALIITFTTSDLEQ